jgi:lipopolysaccharide/colanic/teichoic acid biosynthesis glycosyltransferase
MIKVNQRFFDIIFSLLAILLLSPVFIVASVVLLVVSGDGIIYTQKRIGLDGKVFGVYKFVTMIKDSEILGSGIITIKNDSRVFPFGKFLRKTKINELPQLFNIVKGDMSIIGPRPVPEKHFLHYEKSVQENIKRIKPGLSGLGSIIFRDEEEILEKVNRNQVEFYDLFISPYKGKIETWYVENTNIFLYFKLIWITIKVVIFPNHKINFQESFKNIPTPPNELKVLL